MRKLLQQFKKIVFFDTETTGLDPEKDQIIELAAALVTENGIELKIDAFCKLPEGEKIPEKIVELTHITDDTLADKGIDYREACRIFCNMLHSDSEVLLVAHNIQFDLLFILEMFKRCGMVPKAPKIRALDSLTVYTRLSSRMFTATVVGKDKNGRKITEGRETYKTPSGVYEIKDWARLVEKAAEADGLLPLLEQIKRHVKEYAWMKNASDINVLILAAECLTGRAYEHWEGFVIPMNTQADETGQLTFCF